MYGGTRSTRTASTHNAISATRPMPAMTEPLTPDRGRVRGTGAASSTELCNAASGLISARCTTSAGETADRVSVSVIGCCLLRIEQTADLACERRIARMAHDGVEAA